MENIKFKIFDSNWTIKFKENVFTQLEDGREVWAYGITEPAERCMYVSTKTESGKDIPPLELKLTALHELVHAFLISGQYLQCSSDEPLVEWLARCILNMINNKTADKVNNIK